MSKTLGWVQRQTEVDYWQTGSETVGLGEYEARQSLRGLNVWLFGPAVMLEDQFKAGRVGMVFVCGCRGRASERKKKEAKKEKTRPKRKENAARGYGWAGASAARVRLQTLTGGKNKERT